MKLDISTVVKQDDFVQGYLKGSMTLESKYGWVCPKCGNYTHEFVTETFSHYNNMAHRETIITRSLTFHNDGQDWLCEKCKEDTKRRGKT